MRYQVDIPEGSVNNFSVSHVTTSTWAGQSEPLDRYTILFYDPSGTGVNTYPIMQDTTKEFRECQEFVNNATGDVLVAGLGLGCIHIPLLNNLNVSSVTIVEKYQEVIDLVWSHCPKDDRFRIIHDDIYTWTPDRHFNVGWFDSWIGEDVTNQKLYFNFSPDYEQTMTNKYSDHCDQMFFWRSEATQNNNPFLEG